MTREDFIKAGFTEEEINDIVAMANGNAPASKPETDIESRIKLAKKNTIDDVPKEVTTIYDLQRYAGGQIVRLPDFAEGQPFIARMRRPSLLIMAKKGKIPNRLLATATELFNGGGSSNANNDTILSDTYDVCEAIAEAALVEPTMAEIEKAGLELSDNQLIAIFNYAQRGVEALNNFR